MADVEDLPARLAADAPIAITPMALTDRHKLALIALERTRMPMVVSDPRLPDNPVVLANQAFLDQTGYAAEEVLGRNCRFLQGPDTDRNILAEVARALAAERTITVELLNQRKDGMPFWNELHISPIHDDHGKLIYFFGSQMDITRRREADALAASEHHLLREIDHRAKNALALVQGIVRLSNADDAQAYAGAVQKRVGALARAHRILSDARWHDVPLERVIEGEVGTFGRERARLDGPNVGVPATRVQALTLLLHELIDNAARHGSLSVPEGSIAIRWWKQAGWIVVELIEAGGPPPPPAGPAPGFGMTMIRAIARAQLSGQVEHKWHPDGLQSVVTFAA